MIVFERSEERTAVLYDDNGIRTVVSADMLDCSVSEGDVVYEKNGKYYPDKKETQQRKSKNLSLLHKLGL